MILTANIKLVESMYGRGVKVEDFATPLRGINYGDIPVYRDVPVYRYEDKDEPKTKTSSKEPLPTHHYVIGTLILAVLSFVPVLGFIAIIGLIGLILAWLMEDAKTFFSVLWRIILILGSLLSFLLLFSYTIVGIIGIALSVCGLVRSFSR
jgi:hypothetical protein